MQPLLSRPSLSTIVLTSLFTLGAPWGRLRAQATLLRDLNATAPPPPTSSPTGLSALSPFVLFAATAPATGRELWMTPGLPGVALLVKDIRPGPGDSTPGPVTVVNGIGYFAADDGVHGSELWRTDVTAAGTFLVKDIRAGSSGSSPMQLIAMGSSLLFLADDGVHGVELWRSDGTAAGTVLVADIHPSSAGPVALPPIVVNGNLYFAADDGVHGAELWRSDGTTAGTVMVLDIVPGSGMAMPHILRAFGNRVAFIAYGAASMEVWTSDGTAAGTSRACDLGLLTLRVPELAVLGNRLLFTAGTPGQGLPGTELWISDGTPAGSSQLMDINPGTLSSTPQGLTTLGNRVFFSADDGSCGRELWATDGTAAGTMLVRDISPGAAGSGPFAFFGDGTRLWFQANDGTAGNELWLSDGTTGGTFLVADIAPGRGSSLPLNFAVNATLGGVVFTADDGLLGTEPWLSDGTSGGTYLVQDIGTPIPGASLGSAPNGFLAGPTAAWFVAGGTNLWTSDGTSTGTGVLLTGALIEAATRGATVFLRNADGAHGAELWKSDGTVAGTVLVADIRPGTSGSVPQLFTPLSDCMLFAATDANGTGLWRSDGSAAATLRVAGGVRPLRMSRVHASLALFVSGDLASPMAELWRTDGTPAGTSRLLRAEAVPGSGMRVDHLTALGDGTALFVTGTWAAGVELWRTDGTVSGTTLLRDINPGPGSSWPIVLGTHQGRAFFRALEPGTGAELWVSDGTAAGTYLVKDIEPGTAGADFGTAQFCSAGTFAWLTIGTAAAGAGAEPWRTDGTNAGTMMVKDIVPGAGGSFASEYTVVGSRWVYFRASDPNSGLELWRSDGTSAGTTLVQDIHPGPAPSNPGELTVSRGRLFFVADDGVHGQEPWVLAPGAVATAHGTGCGGGTALPAMDATDPILGSTSRFTGRAMPGAAGILLLSRFGPPTDLSLDCTLFLDPTLLIGLATFVPSAGTWSAMVAIPNDASLTGMTVATQALSAPGGSVLGVALSNRVELTLGQ